MSYTIYLHMMTIHSILLLFYYYTCPGLKGTNEIILLSIIIMKKTEKIKEIRLFLLVLALLAINWPILSICVKRGILFLFLYLLAIWILMIAALVYISRTEIARHEKGRRDSYCHL